MHVISVSQNKGGVGKTTVARMLLEYAAIQGLPALGIDIDPQCNLSSRLLKMDSSPEDPDGKLPPIHPGYVASESNGWDGRSSSADLYSEKMTRFGVTPYATSNPHIDILPGYGSGLREAELVTKESRREKVVERLREFLQDPGVQAIYDVVVIDTAPAKGPLAEGAIRAATHIVIPCVMETNSVDGLLGMLHMWRRENRTRTKDQAVEMIGILPNMQQKIALHQGILQSMRENEGLAPYVLPLIISKRAAFAEIDHPFAKPQSIFDLPASNKARQEAEAACRYVFDKAGLPTAKPVTKTKKEAAWPT